MHDHTSILKLVETKWNLPALTYRDANASNLLDCLDFTAPEPAFAAAAAVDRSTRADRRARPASPRIRAHRCETVAMLWRVRAVVLVGVLLFTVACSGSSKSSGFTVCQAITQAEASQATGVSLGPPTANGGANCDLSTAGFTVSVHLVTGGQAKTDFATFDTAAKKDVRTYAAVSAGDAAFSNLNNGRVVKGTQEIILDLSVDGGVVHPSGVNMQDAVAAQAYYAKTIAALLEAIAPHLTG